tara:strand:- start:2348 stop:3451 length:1104 start_codon:yes stop_codon:yes gene_type:complete
MAYFDTKTGSLEEAIKAAVGGKLDEGQVIFVDHDTDDDDFKALVKKLRLKVKTKNDETTVSGNDSNIDKMLKTMRMKKDSDGYAILEEVELDEKFSPKEIKMAIGIASDKRYAGGNMTGAMSAIEKIKKGLSKDPKVTAVIRKQNEGNDKFNPHDATTLKDSDGKKLYDTGIKEEADEFKPHMMYDPKTGKGFKADTMADHLRMKKMGYDHVAPKKEEVQEASGGKEEYQKFFNATMKKFGVKSPSELKGDDKKKFYDAIDAGWEGDNEKKESFEAGTPERTKHTLDTTPGQSEELWNETVGAMQKKNSSMREIMSKMWGVDEGHNPFKKLEDAKKEEKDAKKETKTMTGKPMTKVDIEPDMKEKKN